MSMLYFLKLIKHCKLSFHKYKFLVILKFLTSHLKPGLTSTKNQNGKIILIIHILKVFHEYYFHNILSAFLLDGQFHYLGLNIYEPLPVPFSY